MLKNVFYGCEGGEKKDQDNKMIPCLMEDGFSLLVETSMNIIPLGEMNTLDNALYWVEIFWVLEIVKVVVAVIESVGVRGGSWAQDLIAEGLNSDSSKSVKGKEPVDEAFRMMEQFVMGVLNCLGVKDNVRKHVLEHVNTKLFILVCKRNSLPYMRKAVILLFARFGIVPPSGKTGFDFDQEERLSVSGENFAIDDEFERLRCYLRLPSLTTVCSFLSTDDSIISNLISGWLDHLKAFEPGHFSAASVPVLPSLEIAGLSRRSSIASCSMDITKDHLITLASPIVFDLIDLPDRLDILFEESLKRVCKKCNAVPTDPALCLLW
jgi:E3 ubiquitin-protein ligase UBR1